MDSFKTFMNIFERAVTENNSVNLTEILQSSRKYFQNISKDDSELVLSILFDRNKGLLSFLNNELKKPSAQKGFDKAMKEAFNLLEFTIKQFSDIFVPYIIETKNTCQQALVTRCSSFVRKAASNTFKTLIEKFNEYDLELGDTIKQFKSLFPSLHIKERSLLFPVLGTIIKHNSELPEVGEYSTIIFQQLRNDFKKQFNPQTISQSIDIFQVYFDVFTDVLSKLPSEVIQEYSEELYNWIKELSNPDKYSVKKVTMRAAVDLLAYHMNKFREFVYRDYKYWYILLVNLIQNKNVQCSKCSQHALKRFYREIGCILNLKTSDQDKPVFLYFKNLLEEQLKNNQHVNSNMLPFIVFGFSQMAAPCKRYLNNNDVRNMFSLIAHLALVLCSRDDFEQTHLESICNYQEALSEIILHVEDLSLNQINVITKLSIILVKRFPDIPVINRNVVIFSLITTITNIGAVNKNLLEEFLHHLIHDGVVWTCSHTLLIDAELQRGINSLKERPVCYKDYLPLWLELLKPCRYKVYRLVQQVADSIIRMGIMLISKLNLNIKTKEDNVFSDVAFSQIAENHADFRMFVNIVDLYVNIIKQLEPRLLMNTLQEFTLKIINMSSKHPLVSGFYKLVCVLFDHICNFNMNDIETEIFELLYKYLMNILNMISTFSNELLTTCLYLILNTPILFVEHILNSTIPALKIACTIGLSDFELARATLNALETWTNELNKKYMKEFLQEIVPCLEPYLHSKESSVEFLQDILNTERKVIKHIILRYDEDTLERFQMRILLFIASLDTDIILNFIYKRSMDVGASWSKKDLLKYSLTFLDTQVDIHFDQILPRLILLAQNSGDRRTKIIACEVLHSVISFILGKTSQHLTTNADKFVSVYMTLYPALLNLGCDLDETARNIFQPLTLQLTHWLSSKFMLKSPATIHFLDALFDGLSNESNSSLREFSGICLAEFTKWSIKQSDDERTIQLNIDEIIYKMMNFALHPSLFKRIAAATAFNHLYTILREDEKIICVYWLEILYCFVKSLNGCNDISIITALDHVERVLIAKKDLLNDRYKNRRKPREFEDVTLTDAVYWLFTQCGCLDQCCRVKCIELVTKVSAYVNNCDSVKMLINNYISAYGMEKFNLVILKDLKVKIESIASSNIIPFLRSLDCYIWLIRNDLVDVQYLFGDSNLSRETIFSCAQNFIHVMNRIKVEENDINSLTLSEELDTLQMLQCKMIIALFDFLQILLNLDPNLIPDFFLNNDLYELIAKCIMCPQVVGFNTKNFEIIEALPLIMGNLLQSIIQKTDNSLWYSINCELSIYVEKQLNSFLNLETIVCSLHDRIALKQYVQGLTFLEHHNLLKQLPNATHVIQHIQQPEDNIVRIFKILVKEQTSEFICVDIKTTVKDYLRTLMEFLFIYYMPSLMKKLITLIGDNTPVTQESTKVEYGIYFLHTFKNEIFRYMLKDPKETIQICNDLLQGNPSLLLTITEQLFIFVQHHKKELHDSTQILVNIVIKKFKMFENVINNFEERKQKLISIFGIAVHLMFKPIEVLSLNKDFYAWILNQLVENCDIQYKLHILNNFLVCLTDMTSSVKPELLAILCSLKNDRLDVSPSDFVQRNVKALKVINCFQTLLTLLPVTKSVIVFQSVISFAAGISEQLFNEKMNEYLQKYFSVITSEYVIESIESAYKLFMNLNSSTNDRFDILQKFLLPSFQFCKVNEIRKFFERNIKEIYLIICQGLIGNNLDIKQLVVSKIGCYNLTEIMFAKIDMQEIDNTESVITRNAIDNVITGKELIQSLYSNVLNVRMLKIPDPEHKEIIRLLHCSAYNCSISIVSSLKKDEDSYISIFAENRKKEQLIWENIVDCQKQYTLKQIVNKHPKYCKKLINIRKKLKQKKAPQQNSHFYSYDLSTCSLNEDINAYDFNETIVYNVSDSKEESMSLTFESDELNNHECMASICGVLTYMISEEISILPTNGDITMPKWLKFFLNSMTSTNYNNVRLFMLKIIFNMQSIFKSYAKFFMEPIMYTVYAYLKENQLNYIIFDIVEMLIDWQITYFQKSDEFHFNETNGKTIVQQFWEIMIQKIIVTRTSETVKTVYKYNMSMIKTILEVWHSYLKLPANLEDKMKTEPMPTVYLILICLANRMEKDIIQRNDIIDFLEQMLEHWQEDEKTVLQTCECCGLILKFIADCDTLTNRIIEYIRKILRQMQTKFENRQIKCIRALCEQYPKAAMIYFDFVTANIFRVDVLGRSNCLEIFLQCIPNFSVDQILKELAYIKFQDLLKNKVVLCEEIALKIINSLVPILPSSNILPLTHLVLPYTKDNSSKHREIAYNIFINIYMKYVTNTSEGTDVKELMFLSTEMLLNGILDPTEMLQNKISKFWAEDAQLRNTCKERLLEILSKYTSAVSNCFLPFMLLMILDLTKKSSNYTETLFEPLHNCSYRDYKIAFSWRTKNLGSKAPLFAPSLTSQINQTFTQMSGSLSNVSYATYIRPTYNSNAQLELQATQELEFEPTYVNEESVRPSDSLGYDSVFKVPAIPQPFHNKRSPRFLNNSTVISAAAQQKEIMKNIHRAEMIKEENARQRNSIKLYRKYRIGDFPDVEISHATLIEPLQQLVTKDQLICKDLTVSIVCSLLKECRPDTFVEQIANNVKRIIENAQGSNFIARAILEILLDTRVTNCSPKLIAKVSRVNNLNFLGSLVLEENLIYGVDISAPPEKKARSEDMNDPSSEWLQLTNLYQSMNNMDMVLSIFKNHITDEDIRVASFAQASNNWLKAKVAYEKAYETESELVKEHCLQSLFDCLSNLCSWDEVDKHIKNRLQGNINNIWNDPWKEWMFPWLFEVFTRNLVNVNYSNEFRDDINVVHTWLGDEMKVKHIKRFFGEESSMFFLLSNQLEVARDFLLNTLDEMREDWIRLHPLSTQLRIRKLQKLRIINDVNQFIKILKTVDNTSDLLGVLKFWSNSLPSAQDALLPWDKLISYRTYFINSVLDDKLKQFNDDSMEQWESMVDEEEIGISQKLQTITFNMRLKMVEASLNQKHKYIAKKYLQEIEQHQSLNDESLHQFLLAGAKLKFLIGEIETNVKKKLSNYSSSWKHCHDLLQKDNLSTMINIGARRQISNIASKLVKLSKQEETFSTLLIKNTIILKEVNGENKDLSTIKDSLETYSFNNLVTCCNMKTSNINENHYILSKYCYDKLSQGVKNIQFSREFVRSTLIAMTHGSEEAAHYFPCLLKPEYFEDKETKDIFMNHSKHVRTWLFLSWQAQLFSHLGTSIATLILPIIKRIIETYPNAVIYTFHLTIEMNPTLLNDPRTYEIRQLVYNRPDIDRFLKAMQYVAQPELYLQYYLTELIKNLSLGTSTAINMFLKKVYPNVYRSKDGIKPGSIFNEIKRYESEIKALEHKSPEEIKRQVVRIMERIRESLRRRKNKCKLSDYSPWLTDFSETDIEIPGQYTGNREPMSQYHAKIIKIEPTVKVMQSVRRPIRITMLGNDGKEYNFLVKFGEDLRQDQRLQQLFSTMNKVLHIDAACRQRQLSIDTYQVIPMSKTVGFIQWVQNTRSLQESIYFTLSNQEANRYDSIPKEYAEWIRNAATSGRLHESYKETVIQYNATKVVSKMNEFISKTRWDSLRRTFTVLCPSIEGFVTMRQNFITSYATMCIAHWILGIGDRHLENTLIMVDSGRCLGIDFGLAFDAGVDQKIPELMPFRLTPQILGLLKPFTEKDLLSEIMIYALHAIRNEQGPILSCMDVFVHEPLNWTEHINKMLKENEEDIPDIKWIPMKKIEAVMKKLNGIKPSLITLDQLKEQHNDKYFDKYRAIIIGDDDIKRIRTKINDNFLTSEEQVECLLDQATDLNILGRTFVGWKPWL